MLNKKQIEANIKTFEEANVKYSIFTKELEDFLGEDFFFAPASNMLDMFGCFPGGLVNHLILMCKYAVQINDLLPSNIRIAKESIVKTVFLSQIGKTFMFIPTDSEWHKKNMGKYYEYNQSLTPMKVTERSLFYINKHGVKINEEEYQAILNLDKDPDDKQAKFYSLPLTHLLRQAKDLAIIEEKYREKQKEIIL